MTLPGPRAWAVPKWAAQGHHRPAPDPSTTWFTARRAPILPASHVHGAGPRQLEHADTQHVWLTCTSAHELVCTCSEACGFLGRTGGAASRVRPARHVALRAASGTGRVPEAAGP